MSSRAALIKGGRFDWSGMILYSVMTVFALLMVMPLVYLITTAFKPLSELFLFPPRFFVMNPTMRNFFDLFAATEASVVPFSRYVFNSLFVAIAIVAAGVFISAMAAYPLSKHKTMPFREPLFKLIVLALMFAPQVTQIPQYIIMSRSGTMDTYFALILPGLAAPMGLFLMKQYLDSVPDALLEAARMDGAGEWRTFIYVVMPMLMPAVATMTLLTFIGAWNNAGPAMLYTTTDQMKTLPYAIGTISGGAGSVARVGALAAASLLMIIPTLVMFIVTQRRVMETMAHSGIKA
ncbi:MULTISPECIES: carbohydrate ABC transporter permease [Paenibacillus]|jgi:ABC-type glycerol-3-phosphate transport system permease component|uniref:Carbohydrate ABC transporter permease n=1 Tax=Paenibacillus oceani TaxID=2772510 RepID=A0A927C635_9BACL|nr:carbohydrate ABC transporter permease [Paenibacillus oceani]MBD2861519.1 carbohydrate ABC transporter permease [Paenibacillus oceani]MDF2660115.1 transporter permease [Paenibacillus sp.]